MGITSSIFGFVHTIQREEWPRQYKRQGPRMGPSFSIPPPYLCCVCMNTVGLGAAS